VNIFPLKLFTCVWKSWSCGVHSVSEAPLFLDVFYIKVQATALPPGRLQTGGPLLMLCEVPGTQLPGWSPHWGDARCSCYVTAAWLGPAPFLGAGATVRPSTPSWGLVLQCRGLSGMAGPLTGVMPAARATSRQRGMCWCYSAGDSAVWLVPSLV
jgi:hypothetical protein